MCKMLEITQEISRLLEQSPISPPVACTNDGRRIKDEMLCIEDYGELNIDPLNRLSKSFMQEKE